MSLPPPQLAARLPDNYFNAPLVGNSYRADGVDPTEILNYLFKKSFGIPNTQVYNAYYGDNPATFNSIPSVKTEKIYSQKIPFTAPTDMVEDTNWNTLGFGGTKLISSSIPYLANYQNVNMTYITGTYFPSFSVGQVTYPVAIYSTNTIPFYYGDGASYNITITASNETPLDWGSKNAGSWIMDTDSGVLTFYDDVTITDVTVSAANPPKISFWRYEGLTGNANIVEVFDA